MKKQITLITLTFCSLFLFGQSSVDQFSDSLKLRAMYDMALEDGEAYSNLRYLCKDIGGRLSGSDNAAKAVEWGKAVMENYGFDKVWLQPVMVPNWHRGEKEIAEIIHSDGSRLEIPITAFGFSVATPPEGITAEVVEVFGLDDVKKMEDGALDGKIVFYNRAFDAKLINTFHAYGGCVDQRGGGASAGASKGAVASVVRSMASGMNDVAHTGVQRYSKEVTENPAIDSIPTAGISTNAAAYLSNALRKDPGLKLFIRMNCKNNPDVQSYNVIGEITGSEYPDEVILVSGHLDSWDTGEGAHDDGTGVVQSIEVLRLFKEMGIQPKRTLRCVLWMSEENSAAGAIEYAKRNKEDGVFHLAAIESDRGGFTPRGFTIDGSDQSMKNEAMQRLEQWSSLLEPYDLHRYDFGFSGVDVNKLKDQDYVLMGYLPDSQRYFDYHHTGIDRFEAVNERELNLGTASMASLVYLIDKYGFKDSVFNKLQD